jgi:hypothetical protein
MSKPASEDRSHERTYDSASIVLTGHGLTAAVSATTTVLSETSVLVLAIMVVVTLRTPQYPKRPFIGTIYTRYERSGPFVC